MSSGHKAPVLSREHKALVGANGHKALVVLCEHKSSRITVVVFFLNQVDINHQLCQVVITHRSVKWS